MLVVVCCLPFVDCWSCAVVCCLLCAARSVLLRVRCFVFLGEWCLQCVVRWLLFVCCTLSVACCLLPGAL